MHRYFGTVSGGVNNESAHTATVGGGFINRAIAYGSVIDGGEKNAVELAATCAVIGGGFTNRIYQGSAFSVIGGGSGAFAEVMLKRLLALDAMPARYAILEPSADLRERQR